MLTCPGAHAVGPRLISTVWLDATDSGLQCSAADRTAAGPAGFFSWKHCLQSTGRPCVGLNGTVVSAPHSEHTVRVSARTWLPERDRFALHALQRFGSFLNCLSWKNNCSPAVNTNSLPQSTHFRILSTISMGNPSLRPGADALHPLRLSHKSISDFAKITGPAAGIRHFQYAGRGCRPQQGKTRPPRLTPNFESWNGGSARRDRHYNQLLLLFTSLLAIPLPRQRFLHAALLAWLQIKGVALHFLDNVLLLNLTLEATQRVFEGLAFL